MKKGIITTIDWGYIGACLANEDTEEQAKFFDAFTREVIAWENSWNRNVQMSSINSSLDKRQKELLSIISDNSEV